MAYQVKRINKKEEIESCDQFAIEQYYWDSKQEPKAHGWMGYLENQGFFVKMVCEEKNPRREHTEHRKRVCDDSGMEIFFAFTEENEDLSNDSMYINFEMNANGALYAKYGKGRKNRTFITEEVCEMCQTKGCVEEDTWSVEILIPESFLEEICDFERIKAGKMFYFNFYKISETKEIEHFGSCYPINSPTPNFHLPVCFGKAVIA